MIPSRKHFYGAVAVQVAVLLFMIGNRLSVSLTGDVVRLKVVPVDPRSLMRGDYVILTYDFTRLDVSGTDRIPGASESYKVGDRVYVRYRADAEGFIQPMEISRRPFTGPDVWEPGKRGFLRGRVDRIGWGGGRTLNVNYGIENWFVPEGTGRAIEKLARQGKLTVKVAVASNGEAILKELER